jgi:hypothetical protein
MFLYDEEFWSFIVDDLDKFYTHESTNQNETRLTFLILACITKRHQNSLRSFICEKFGKVDGWIVTTLSCMYEECVNNGPTVDKREKYLCRDNFWFCNCNEHI